MLEDRFTRQRRLAEVGEAGQARIAAAVAEVRGRDGARYEAEYLRRAGVKRLTFVPDAEALPFPHAEAFEHPAARSVAAGAWRALCVIKTALAGAEP